MLKEALAPRFVLLVNRLLLLAFVIGTFTASLLAIRKRSVTALLPMLAVAAVALAYLLLHRREPPWPRVLGLAAHCGVLILLVRAGVSEWRLRPFGFPAVVLLLGIIVCLLYSVYLLVIPRGRAGETPETRA